MYFYPEMMSQSSLDLVCWSFSHRLGSEISSLKTFVTNSYLTYPLEEIPSKRTVFIVGVCVKKMPCLHRNSKVIWKVLTNWTTIYTRIQKKEYNHGNSSIMWMLHKLNIAYKDMGIPLNRSQWATNHFKSNFPSKLPLGFDARFQRRLLSLVLKFW